MTRDWVNMDLRTFAGLIEHPIPAKFRKDLVAFEKFEPLVNLRMPIEILMTMVLWTVCTRNTGLALLVMPSKSTSARFLSEAYRMLQDSDEEDVRDRFDLIGHTSAKARGMIRPLLTHASSGTLGIEIPPARTYLTVFVPDLDKICGPHQKYVKKLTERKNTSVVVNLAI